MSDQARRGGGRRRRRRPKDKERRAKQTAPQSSEPVRGAREPAQPQRGKQQAKSRRGGRRREGQGGEGRAREREPRLHYQSIITIPEAEARDCPICGKKVRDPVAALAYGEERAPAHFDCVLESVRGGRELGGDERLCYLGGGNFGVVRFPHGEGTAPFSIKDRVQYESGQERPEWRKDLDSVRRK